MCSYPLDCHGYHTMMVMVMVILTVMMTVLTAEAARLAEVSCMRIESGTFPMISMLMLPVSFT